MLNSAFFYSMVFGLLSVCSMVICERGFLSGDEESVVEELRNVEGVLWLLLNFFFLAA